MKFDKKQVLIIVLLAFLAVSSLVVYAQTTQLSESDKAQIITIILKNQKFRDPEYPNADHTVFLLADNISFELLPQIKDVEFVTITKKQIDEMKKTGVEFYSFSAFEVKEKTIEVTFGRDYVNSSAKYSNGNATVYDCRKVSGNWKCKGGKPSAYVGES